MYNADDIIKIGSRYVLPAIARWNVSGQGGLSSISIDRSAIPNRLTGINYTPSGQAYVQSFALDADGGLADSSTRAQHPLVLKNSFGDRGRTIHSFSSLTIPGTNFQGVATVGEYGLANSSALTLSSARRSVDAMVVFKNGKVLQRFQMPRGNVESIYIDYQRDVLISVTEAGSQFLFQLPLGHLLETAER